MLKPLLKDKRGQFLSILLVVVTIVIIGIIIFFFNHMNAKIYDSLDKYLEGKTKYNNTEAQQTAEKLSGLETSRMWDWVFFAIFIGLVIQMLFFSFASKTNVAFFWIFVIMGIIILIVGVSLSNIWQDTVAQAEFATTIARFPITNAILGTYFPTIIVGVLFLGIIILFGKFPGQGGE